MGFIEGFKQGLSGDSGARRYRVAGVDVVCKHCAGEVFEEGDALLNTPGLTFFGLDWANRGAHLLVCERCSSVQWFLREPEVR